MCVAKRQCRIPAQVNHGPLVSCETLHWIWSPHSQIKRKWNSAAAQQSKSAKKTNPQGGWNTCFSVTLAVTGKSLERWNWRGNPAHLPFLPCLKHTLFGNNVVEVVRLKESQIRLTVSNFTSTIRGATITGGKGRSLWATARWWLIYE